MSIGSTQHGSLRMVDRVDPGGVDSLLWTLYPVGALGQIAPTVIATPVAIGGTGQVFDELLHIERDITATGGLHSLVQQALTVTGGAGADVIDIDTATLGTSGTTNLAGGLLAARNSFVQHNATGGGPTVIGYFAQVGAGDFSGVTNIAVGSVPLAAGYTSQVAYGTCTSGSITDAAAYYAFAPFNTSVARTITTSRGLLVENQGATGITNAIGVDILAQSGAATLNFGIRCAALANFIGIAAPAAAAVGSIHLYVDVADGKLYAKGPATTTPLANP